jgi:hypothetical protein
MTSAIESVANFLNQDIRTEQIKALVDHLDVKNFRHNPAVNCDSLKEAGILLDGEEPFIRKGK